MTRGRAALGCVAGSLGLVWLTAFLGPSAAAHPIGGHLSLDVRPSAWLVTALLAVATLAGAAGVLLALSALHRGWAPDPRRLVAGALVAVAALAVVPPVTSDDVYSYAAYGRMAATGRDPYATRPVDLDDPVGRAVGRPWRRSPSIYGPVATGVQRAVMEAAGPSVAVGVGLLQLVAAGAFGVSVLLLDQLAGGADRRRRAAVLFALNPLVVIHLVAGAHVDALLVLALLAAVALARRNALAAGVAAGLGFGVKLTGALVVLGVAVMLRRHPRRLAVFAAGAIAVAVPAYLAVGGLDALAQARKASRFVSLASPWRPLAEALDTRLGFDDGRAVVGLLALAVAVALVVLLARGAPATPARPVLVLTLAWLLAATYLLPWYDAAAWSLLALAVPTAWDRLLLVRTTALTLAYLPGRTVPLPPGLAGLTAGVRTTVTPVVLGATVVWAIRLSARNGALRPAASDSRRGGKDAPA